MSQPDSAMQAGEMAVIGQRLIIQKRVVPIFRAVFAVVSRFDWILCLLNRLY